MNSRTLTVYYTSDLHGCFSVKNGQPGLSAVMRETEIKANTLLIDGGDVMQGSPFSYYLSASGRGAAGVTAALMNLAGYRFVTLGNHDFSYGKEELEKYLASLDAVCLCANVEGVKGVEKRALVTLENGLRIGLTGVITPKVPQWEKPEDLAGVTFTDPLPAAGEALEALRAQGADITVCICHMGFERDPVNGTPVSDAEENRAYAIAASLDFSLVLAGHTHAPFAGGLIRGTFACAPADKALSYIRAEICEDGTATATLCRTGIAPDPKAEAFLRPFEEECNAFLSRPLGRLSAPIPQEEFLAMALHGSALANLFNRVQQQITGADISCTSLQNTPPALGVSVCAGDVIAAYPFPNTLTVLEIDRSVLCLALERSASFLRMEENGRPAVDSSALLPAPQFFNFDYFYGLRAEIDLSRPAGERVRSVLFEGKELPAGRKLRLCLNNYRASGAGGYPFYRSCPVLYTGKDEVQTLLLDHFRDRARVDTDTERYIDFYYGKELL